MKKISVLLAFLTLLVANFAFAQGAAIVASLTGTAQVQTGASSARALRQGDEVRQGDTVSTGASSSLVLKFDDGEVAALTQNSRMTITAYQYQPAARTGNVLLSLVTGGMRAISGLIGRSQPERVAYRAATATIGIRGTDVTIATDGTNVIISVDSGSIILTIGGKDYTLNAGQTGYIQGNTFHPGPAPAGTISSSLGFAVTDLQGMTNAINADLNSAAGTGTGTGTGAGSTGSPNTAPGGGGGGSASVH